MQNKSRAIWAGIGIILLFVVVIVLAIVNFVSQQDKYRVEIEVLPEDARVTLDGTEIRTGRVYVKPGTHDFSASKDGFSADTKTIEVTEDGQYIGLLPQPESDEAREWADQYALQRESIGGRAANERGLSLRERYPLVNELPYVEIAGPFNIQYRFAEEERDGLPHIYISIEDSTPDGRIKALAWIREQGYDPVDYDIRYEEFDNPLTSGGRS